MHGKWHALDSTLHQNTGYPRLGEMLLMHTPTAMCIASPITTDATSISIYNEQMASRA